MVIWGKMDFKDLFGENRHCYRLFQKLTKTLFTWYYSIGESTIADALIDRNVNSLQRINLTRESLRK